MAIAAKQLEIGRTREGLKGIGDRCRRNEHDKQQFACHKLSQLDHDLQCRVYITTSHNNDMAACRRWLKTIWIRLQRTISPVTTATVLTTALNAVRAVIAARDAVSILCTNNLPPEEVKCTWRVGLHSGAPYQMSFLSPDR